MASKQKGSGSTESQVSSNKAEMREVSVGSSEREEQIRLRAYQIYLERGQEPGRDLDDWLQAERELERGLLSRAQAG
jgi:hypothetical protein